MSKGAKKPKIHDLSRSFPTEEEIDAVWEAIGKAEYVVSPIVAAILGVACVEYRLEGMLRKRFLRNNDDEWAKLTSDEGPLGTFFQRFCVAMLSKFMIGTYMTK